MRSHKAKRKSSKLVHIVDRRVPHYREKRGQPRMTLAETMKVNGNGYGPLAELEQRLASIKPNLADPNQPPN